VLDGSESDGELGSAKDSTTSPKGGLGDMLVFIDWMGDLEELFVSRQTSAKELRDLIASAPEAPAEHKQLIFRGILLDDRMVLFDFGFPLPPLSYTGKLPLLRTQPGMFLVLKARAFCRVRNGAVFHLVLDDQPWSGRPIFVRTSGEVRVLPVRCSEHSSIGDVKEEVAVFPGLPPPEDQRLVFAGRELEDQHTLREYNIQKPSVLQLISYPPRTPRQARPRPPSPTCGLPSPPGHSLLRCAAQHACAPSQRPLTDVCVRAARALCKVRLAAAGRDGRSAQRRCALAPPAPCVCARGHRTAPATLCADRAAGRADHGTVPAAGAR